MKRAHEDGQMTIEMMLILIALLGLSLALSRKAQNEGWMKAFVSGPWKPVQAMIENGVWTTADSKTLHPHHRNRHGSYDGDGVNGEQSGTGELE